MRRIGGRLGWAGVSAMVLGGFHTCALLVGGGVKCWGYNGYWQLGTGDTSDRSSPVSVSVGSGEKRLKRRGWGLRSMVRETWCPRREIRGVSRGEGEGLVAEGCEWDVYGGLAHQCAGTCCWGQWL